MSAIVTADIRIWISRALDHCRPEESVKARTGSKQCFSRSTEGDRMAAE